MAQTKHEHQWVPISYTLRPDGTEGEPVLWSCAGRTSRGNYCIASTTTDPRGKDRARQAQEELEREQRHTNL